MTTPDETTQVDPTEADKLATHGALLLDVREPEVWAVVAFLTLTRCTTLAARRTQANALGPLADTPGMDRHLADLTTDDLDTALDNMAASPRASPARGCRSNLAPREDSGLGFRETGGLLLRPGGRGEGDVGSGRARWRWSARLLRTPVRPSAGVRNRARGASPPVVMRLPSLRPL